MGLFIHDTRMKNRKNEYLYMTKLIYLLDKRNKTLNKTKQYNI